MAEPNLAEVRDAIVESYRRAVPTEVQSPLDFHPGRQEELKADPPASWPSLLPRFQQQLPPNLTFAEQSRLPDVTLNDVIIVGADEGEVCPQMLAARCFDRREQPVLRLTGVNARGFQQPLRDESALRSRIHLELIPPLLEDASVEEISDNRVYREMGRTCAGANLAVRERRIALERLRQQTVNTWIDELGLTAMQPSGRRPSNHLDHPELSPPTAEDYLNANRTLDLDLPNLDLQQAAARIKQTAPSSNAKLPLLDLLGNPPPDPNSLPTAGPSRLGDNSPTTNTPFDTGLSPSDPPTRYRPELFLTDDMDVDQELKPIGEARWRDLSSPTPRKVLLIPGDGGRATKKGSARAAHFGPELLRRFAGEVEKRGHDITVQITKEDYTSATCWQLGCFLEVTKGEWARSR